MSKLPKRRILRQKLLFQQVYRSGTSYANRFLVLYVFPANGPGRVGFAAGKKLGNAVTRNRLKRIMRESYRHQLEKIRDDVWLLMVARRGALQIKQPVMEKALLILGKKAKIFSK